MLLSKIKEIIFCLRAGRVTLPYPFQPRTPAPDFRGRPAIDGAKCLGCGACAQVCPPRLITVQDEAEIRRLELDYARCTYCARCQDVCPTGAVYLTDEFELATDDKADLKLRVELTLAKCERCGSAFMTQRLLEKLTGEFSPAWLPSMEQPPEWFGWCSRCRRAEEGRRLEGGFKGA